MKKHIFTLTILLFVAITIFAQNPQWITYNNSNSGLPDNAVYSITIDGTGNKWIGTSNGLAKFEDTTWTTYGNSSIQSIAIDGSENKWIGSYFGNYLAKFDDTTWTFYNIMNWGMTTNSVSSIAIDGNENKWIGTNTSGFAKFDDTTWTTYKSSNSGLPYDGVTSIVIDENGDKWIGIFEGGLIKFDDTTWTIYNSSNSGLPYNTVFSLAIDESGNKWIGTYLGGLAKFDGTTWTTYNISNSGLPNNTVRSIAIDGSGNKWIGTTSGLAIFNESGIVLVEENKQLGLEINIYPNPATDKITITSNDNFSKQTQIIIFNITGVQIMSTQIKNQNSVDIDVSTLVEGFYIVKVQSNNSVGIKKFLKINNHSNR